MKAVSKKKKKKKCIYFVTLLTFNKPADAILFSSRVNKRITESLPPTTISLFGKPLTVQTEIQGC
jgi:hypothetical protein